MVPKLVKKHDYKRFPELTKNQLEEFGFTSPHQQITEDFEAKVVRVHDGDTITINTNFRDFDFPMRFLDIDSKELGDGGEEAAQWLKNKLTGENVRISIDPQNRVDKYGRLLGRVLHRGLDVGQEELNLGLATPFNLRNEGKIPDIDEVIKSAA